MITLADTPRAADAPDDVARCLRAAARALSAHSDSPRLDAELLLGRVLGVTRSALIARGEETLADELRSAFEALVERRRQGTPVAYLTGTREFWSLALTVTPAVLVPRPETELLVELALKHLARDQPCAVLDLGTGSGAIALAIASERPQARITGVDVSPGALGVAQTNAAALGAAGIEWRQGSWFAPVAGRRFDLIVGNPPYVAADDPALQRLRAEPALALCPGPSGLEAFTAIIERAAAHLNDRGWLLLEHGRGQARAVADLLTGAGFATVRTHTDLSGHPRVTSGTIDLHH